MLDLTALSRKVDNYRSAHRWWCSFQLLEISQQSDFLWLFPLAKSLRSGTHLLVCAFGTCSPSNTVRKSARADDGRIWPAHRCARVKCGRPRPEDSCYCRRFQSRRTAHTWNWSYPIKIATEKNKTNWNQLKSRHIATNLINPRGKKKERIKIKLCVR